MIMCHGDRDLLMFSYKERVVIEPHPTTKKFENFELSGKIYCKNCHWNWGVMGVYKNVPFPIIKIDEFVIVSPSGGREKYKKWKEVPLDVKPIGSEDLAEMRTVDGEKDSETELWREIS